MMPPTRVFVLIAGITVVANENVCWLCYYFTNRLNSQDEIALHFPWLDISSYSPTIKLLVKNRGVAQINKQNLQRRPLIASVNFS